MAIRCSVHQHGMLQLVGPYRFSKTVAPHATFWDLLAKTVQKAYPLGLLGSLNQRESEKDTSIKNVY